MKKLFYASMIAILVFLSLGSMDATAQPAGDWVSNIYCVNQTSTVASIALKFYNAGTLTYTKNDTIAGGKSKYYFPSDLGALGSFSGSLVIESDKGLSCSVQTSSKATGTTASPFMYGASGGFDQNLAKPVMYVSQVMKNFSSGAFGFYRSYIAIQNTTGATVNVRIEYMDRYLGKIAAATQTLPVQKYSNILIHTHNNANLPDQFLGFAKVSAVDGVSPLVVQSAYYNDSTSYSKAQFALYNGMPTGEAKIYAPFIMRNFYDYNAGFNVVNVGTTATSFKIEFTIGRTIAPIKYTYQYPYLLAPDQVVAFFTPDIPALNPVDGLAIQDRAGSAIIYATNTSGALNPSGKLVANINFRNDGRYAPTPNFGGAAGTYNAVGAEFAGKKLFVPNAQNKVGGAQFTSGFNVANLDNTAGSCTYKFVDAPAVVFTQPIPANGIYSVLVSNIPGLPVGYNSAATIECTVNVVAIITSRADASGFWGDSTTAINALKP